MDRNTRELTLDDLRQIWGGNAQSSDVTDKYNQTAKGIIDSIGR